MGGRKVTHLSATSLANCGWLFPVRSLMLLVAMADLDWIEDRVAHMVRIGSRLEARAKKNPQRKRRKLRARTVAPPGTEQHTTGAPAILVCTHSCHSSHRQAPQASGPGCTAASRRRSWRYHNLQWVKHPRCLGVRVGKLIDRANLSVLQSSLGPSLFLQSLLQWRGGALLSLTR